MSAADLFDHLWQSTLFVGLAAVLAWVCRGAGAHVRYGIWLAASLKFLVPFSLLTALGGQLGWLAPEGTMSTYPSAVQAIAAPVSALASDPASSASASQMVTYLSANGAAAGDSTLTEALGGWLLIAWIAVSAALAARWLLRWNAVRIVVRGAASMSLDTQRTAFDAAPALCNAPFRVRRTSLRIEPGVFGIFRPTLLVPENIFAALNAAELGALVAHESAHVKRRDNLTAAFHSVTEIVFWFHPLVWWIGTRLVAERELACDEAVVRAGNDRSTYAQAILSVCRLYLGAPVVSASGASRGHLKTRIEAILNKPLSAPLGSAKRCLLAAAVTIAVAGPIALGLTKPADAESAATPASTPPATPPAAASPKFSTARIVHGEDSHPATISAEPYTFVAVNATVRDLVRFAYGQRLPPQVSGGPGWLDNERYTIHANVDSAHPSSSMQERVRWLLENRFRFRAHLTKGPVYVLESAADAPASSQRPVQKGIGLIDRKSGSVSFQGASSASVAEALSTFLSSQVLDHTKPGVTYDFKMNWPRNDLKVLGDRLHDQAGLVLRSFAMEQLVIDGADRPSLDTASATEQVVAR